VDDTPETRLEKLVHNLSQYRLPLEETVPLFASLLSLPVPEDQYPPLTLSPQRQRQKTLEAIVAITLELSEQQPVLFILEDGHWLDASTQELLGFLIDQVPTSPILVLITYRPEFQPTWGNRSYLTQVTLNRLSRSQVESMGIHLKRDKLSSIA
jgi:predicted ATPase